MTPRVSAALRAAVTGWVDGDPEASDRAELSDLLARADDDESARVELEDRFRAPLGFGTAGLRGRLGAGPNRMNRAVVIRAAAGLAGYLRDRRPAGPVVIGYDARHGSDRFALDSAGVLTAAGHSALVLPRPLPTPVLAFAVRRLGAAAGVMVTASHNPPGDSGYKVYLDDGCQLVAPADAEISARIAAAPAAASVPSCGGWRRLSDDLVDDYLAAVGALVDPGSPRALDVVYTPLHGVGGDTAVRALRVAGFGVPVVVPDQIDPDPDFPTVAAPNPEEPGAVDRALALAAERGADLMVANDPDADRCAVAVPDRLHGWRLLHGDEVGVLLADHLIRRGATGTFATTIVSSSLLAAIAARHGQPYAETLTGFKWIARVPGLAFGYEEALGYCAAPALVGDKDGISALLLVCELAAQLRADGRTLLDRLDEIAVEYGVHETAQSSVALSAYDDGERALAGLLNHRPARLGGLAVSGVDDLTRPAGGLPPTPGVRLWLEHASDAVRGRVVVRPSGTEPKLKCYVEVVFDAATTDGGPTDGSRTVAAARIAAATRLDAIRADLLAGLA